jgi:uncharacterized protein (DUF2235 family)
MATQKNILFCADGTWNGPDEDQDKDGVPDITNVLKLFLILQGDNSWSSIRLKDEQEKVLNGPQGPIQVAKYLHGVGDSDNPIKRLLGGVFGAGVIARIVRGYTFISRNYNAGDLISIVGFSRGAYTARALAGLISSEGLLDSTKFDLDDKDLGYSLGTSAWRSYREKAANKAKAPETRQRFFSVINQLPGFARLQLKPQETVAAPIQCVAVWDTVGALGVPLFDKDGDQLDIFRFADQDLSPKVNHGIHAISLDEQRVNFQPTLWNRREGVTQCLFAGAHSNVGGGYPTANKQCGLSDIALQWMIEQLTEHGVRFGAVPKDVAPDPLGPLHTPWTEGVFAKLPSKLRAWPQGNGLVEHESIALRIAGGNYNPSNRLVIN